VVKTNSAVDSYVLSLTNFTEVVNEILLIKCFQFKYKYFFRSYL